MNGLIQCAARPHRALSLSNFVTPFAKRTLHIPHRSGLSLLRRKPIQCAPSKRPRSSDLVRLASTEASPDRAAAATAVKPRGRTRRIIFNAFAYSGMFVLFSTGLVLAFFIYDASTYVSDPRVDDVPVSEIALNPRRGGPKNLPIAEEFIGDRDSESREAQKDKPKLVILGTGWGSVALLKSLNPGDYHVTVVSPVNYFLFTPMLPSATVGTLGLRSLVEPIRLIVQRVRGHFLRAEAVDVDFAEKLVEISQVDGNGVRHNFYLPYDKLVIGVGKRAVSPAVITMSLRC